MRVQERDKPMRRVIILQGVSGSGKSTFARNIADKLRFGYKTVTIVSADDYFTTNGVYTFRPEKLTQAHAACFRNFLEALQFRNDPTCVIVDNTNTTHVEIAPYILAARAMFVGDLEVISIICDPTIAKRRNQHGTPDIVIERQHNRIVECGLSWPRHWPALQTIDENGIYQST